MGTIFKFKKTIYLLISSDFVVMSYIYGYTRACLDQHLIAIRSPGIHGDHLRSGTSLIAITRLRRLSLSRLLYKLGLTGHLETVINCTVMHATWWGRRELLGHQQLVVHCGGDPGVS